MNRRFESESTYDFSNLKIGKLFLPEEKLGREKYSEKEKEKTHRAYDLKSTNTQKEGGGGGAKFYKDGH